MPWIYRTITGDIGPIDDNKLKELAALGEITETTQIQRVGMNHFVDASSVKGLVFPVVSQLSGCLLRELLSKALQ